MPQRFHVVCRLPQLNIYKEKGERTEQRKLGKEEDRRNSALREQTENPGGEGRDVTADRRAALSGVMASFHILTAVLVTCLLMFVKLLKPYT